MGTHFIHSCSQDCQVVPIESMCVISSPRLKWNWMPNPLTASQGYKTKYGFLAICHIIVPLGIHIVFLCFIWAWVSTQDIIKVKKNKAIINTIFTIFFKHVLFNPAFYIVCTVYPKKYVQGFCFAVLCCGYTWTDFPISIRLTSLALWQSNDCPSASKSTLMNMDKYFMWIHYERLHNHNKAKHNKTVCIFLGIYCMLCDTIVVVEAAWCLLMARCL